MGPIAILEDTGGSGHTHVQVEKFEGSHSRGARGLGGAEGGPRLRSRTAAPVTVPIYRHHKTPRAGAHAREGG